MKLDETIKKQRKDLKIGESAVTLHTIEPNGYYITIVDIHTEQIIATTEAELLELYGILKRKYVRNI